MTHKQIWMFWMYWIIETLDETKITRGLTESSGRSVCVCVCMWMWLSICCILQIIHRHRRNPLRSEQVQRNVVVMRSQAGARGSGSLRPRPQLPSNSCAVQLCTKLWLRIPNQSRRGDKVERPPSVRRLKDGKYFRLQIAFGKSKLKRHCLSITKHYCISMSSNGKDHQFKTTKNRNESYFRSWNKFVLLKNYYLIIKMYNFIII